MDWRVSKLALVLIDSIEKRTSCSSEMEPLHYLDGDFDGRRGKKVESLYGRFVWENFLVADLYGRFVWQICMADLYGRFV